MGMKGFGITATALVAVALSTGCGGNSNSQSVAALREAVANAPSAPVDATTKRCATPSPRALAEGLGIDSRGPVKFPRTGVEIPVYVHVIENSSGAGAVSDDAVAAQIQVLNDSYAGMTGGADTSFRFRLLGVSRTVNDVWFTAGPFSNADQQMKSSLRAGGATDLNIYINGVSGDTLGYATYPWDYASNPIADGVVLRFDTLPGGAFAPYNLGDTGTHEVGHWLGLLHTFENGCDRPGDQVSDTPAEAIPALGCPIGRDTCTGGKNRGEDPVTNFMNLSDDACMFQFTTGQASRMQKQWTSFRVGN